MGDQSAVSATCKGEQMIPDLKDKNILITGATDGIGYATALQLAGMRANLIICARSQKKAQALINACAKLSRSSRLSYINIDLSNFESCETAIYDIQRLNVDIDFVFVNAGIATEHAAVNAEGLNKTFYVNHIAHFALVTGIIGCLNSCSVPRVIVQSSLAHHASKKPVDFSSYFTKQERPLPSAYADSKLANTLFASGLQEYLDQRGINIVARAVHPGYLVTNINRDTVESSLRDMTKELLRYNYKPLLLKLGHLLGLGQPSASAASQSALHAAFSDVPHIYTGPGSFLELRGAPKLAQLSSLAQCAQLKKDLWNFSRSYCRSRTKWPAIWETVQEI